MSKDIDSQLHRARELLDELEQSCNEDLDKEQISDKTRNLTQEVLTKVRHLLDQSMYVFFDKKYVPTLNDQDKKSAKVYFPVVKKEGDLKSILGRAKMSDLKTKYPAFYQYLESLQPYHDNNQWLGNLSKYASEKHIRLTPQTKIETQRVTVSRGQGSVSWGPGVTFGSGVRVMGVPIDPRTQMPAPNNVAETKVEKWVSFVFEDTNINVLGLCKRSINDGERIVKKVLKFSSMGSG